MKISRIAFASVFVMLGAMGWADKGSDEQTESIWADTDAWFFNSAFFTLRMSAQTHRRAVEAIEVLPVQQSPVVPVAPDVAASPVRRSVSSLGMFWDREQTGNVATDRSDYLSSARDSRPPNSDVLVTSYLNGTVRVRFAPVGGGEARTGAVSFNGVALGGNSAFNGGEYVFIEENSARQKMPRIVLEPGRYTVSVVEPLDLTPAEPGLAVACVVTTGDQFSVGGTPTSPVEITCGTPTKKLSASQLAAAKTAEAPVVLEGPELFSVCLGNGGSDVIFGPPESGGGITSQIGDGVDFVEDLLALQTLQESGGAGIDLNCGILGNVSFEGSVIDEPLWAYLSRLDVLRRLDLSGDLERISPTNGAYGNPEIASLLSPFDALLAAAPFPYGAIPNTPTHRLQFLDFGFNFFDDPAWSDLWRISDADDYAVGDQITTNNFGLVYSFAIERRASPEVVSRLQAGGSPTVEVVSVGFEEEGFEGQISLPLTETGGLVFGPFNVGNDPTSENVSVSVLGVPNDVACRINDQAVENGIGVVVNGFDHTGYEGNPPILISCELRPNTMRVAATFAFPTDQGSLFPEFSGEVSVRVLAITDSFVDTGRIIDTRTLAVSSSTARYFYELSGLSDGNYRISFSAADDNSNYSFGCQNGGRIDFTVAGSNVELGVVQCSESVSSLPTGLIQQCYARAGINFMHELRDFNVGGELDCSGLSGASDFELLEAVIGARTLRLSNSDLTATQIRALSNFSVSFPETSSLRRVLLEGNPGVGDLDNLDFERLLRNFEQVGTGAVTFPLGGGLMAQCLRRSGFASADNAALFNRGDELDCSGLSGADDFNEMSTFMRDVVFYDSVWNFRSAGFNNALVESLTNRLFRQYPSIVLRGNPNLGPLGSQAFVRLTRDFASIDIEPEFQYPSFTYIKASDAAAGDRFGWRAVVSGDGNVLVVSARDKNTSARTGSLYVFAREGGGWREIQQFAPPVFDDNARYGEQLTISADGSYFAASRNLSNGASPTVDVYIRTGRSSWALDRTFIGRDSFGQRVRLFDGDGVPRLFISSLQGVVRGATAGFVEQYVRSGGTWRLEQTLEPQNASGDDGDQFGSSIGFARVGVNNWRVLIGAPGDDSLNLESEMTLFGTELGDNEDPDSGAVWVFDLDHTNGDNYGFIKDIQQRPLGEPHMFGRHIGVDDDDAVIIGARNQLAILNDSISPLSAGQQDQFIFTGPFANNYRRAGALSTVGVGAGLLLHKTGSVALNIPVDVRLLELPSFNQPRERFNFEAQIDPRRADLFGDSVTDLSADGDTIIFGAHADDSDGRGIGADPNNNNATNSGAVYVNP